MRMFLKEAGVIAATTLGAGMFGLPYVFMKSGWLAGVFYLVILGLIVVFSHFLYWQTLAKVDERERLLGLAKNYLGKFWYIVGLISVMAGLLLALVAYLILGSQFIGLFWPAGAGALGIILFWLLSVLPLLFRERRILKFEVLGIFFMAAAIFIIFFGAWPIRTSFSLPAVDFNNIFLPFGVILFSLAGWTAIEPLYAERSPTAKSPSFGTIFWGTFITSGLYLLFIFGIFGSAAFIAPDTVSGILGWPFWKLTALGILGIFALWTSYMPIALEIKNSLVADFRWDSRLSLALVIFLPLILVFLGLNNFLRVIGLAGGVFLGLQYVLIALVSKKALGLRGSEKFFSWIIVAAFIAAAAYEVYYFLIG